MRLKISVVLLLACRALCATLEQIVLANGDFKSSNMIESHDFGLFVRAVMDKWAVQVRHRLPPVLQKRILLDMSNRPRVYLLPW